MKATKNKIVDQETLQVMTRKWQAEGAKIVFTNGCFDILHLGHVEYLEKARALGDRLVLGLNTDGSVRRLKGEGRPLNDQYARARILAALSFVDALAYFDEDTPYELIKQLKPDILVKGSDYLAENIIGADIVIANGGSVETVALVEGLSTTNIIEKIKKNIGRKL